jgi:uncharacterized protein with FMN-binding domain
MKKFTAASLVIIGFIVYALSQKTNGAETTVSPPSPSSTLGNGLTPSSAANSPSSQVYKDGQYTGNSTDAFYGNIQVKAVISGGKITDVAFLDYPHDRGTSIRINTQAMPILKSEAIQVQNANVDIVTGATQSSLAFQQSLASALAQAK